MTIGVAIVGAGLIGARRAAAAAARPDTRVLAVADLDASRAQALADAHQAAAFTDWQAAIQQPGVQAVAVCTTNRDLAPISVAALEAGHHVLVEKPPGRTAAEARLIAQAAATAGRIAKVGFTLRFHPGVRRAQQRCAAGAIGHPFFLRSVYGHGGRPGYAGEWRGNRDLAGGGELLDQGVHLLDLSRWFLGDLAVVAAQVRRYFWEIGDLEDNAFILLGGDDGRLASLQTSWTQWKNRFDLEVYGSDGYLRLSGLGGSYGVETFTHGVRNPESTPPAETVEEFPAPDGSFQADWDDFVAALKGEHPPEVGIDDGAAVMELVDTIYARATVSSAE